MTDTASRGDVLAIEYFENGALILKTDDARMIRFNTTGVDILQLILKGLSEPEMAKRLMHQHTLSMEEARDAISSVEQQLTAAHLPRELLQGIRERGYRQETRP